MAEQQVLYKLVEDVGGLKSDVKNLHAGQADQWQKLNEVAKLVTQCNTKLDNVMSQESRLLACEDGVADYRRTKSRFLGLVAGIGIGTGGVGAGIGSWVMKLFGKG